VCVCVCLSVYLSVDSTAVTSAYDLCETGSLIGTKSTVLSVSVFRRVHKIAKSDYWLRHVCLVSPSAWNSSAPTGRVLIKFNIGVFFEHLLRKIQVLLKSDNNNGYFT
jgi:hypothetical protein